jgi:hypothetical protein
MSEGQRIFDPKDANELLRGWLLHAHKGRSRHDFAARRFEGRKSSLGVPTIILSTIVGTALFASLGKNVAVWAQVTVGFLSVAAAVLSALQTFFDYPARAERHRVTGVRYKTVIRELERVLSEPDTARRHEPAWVEEVRQRLDTLEAEAPVVPPRIYDAIEEQYSRVNFVQEALALYNQQDRSQLFKGLAQELGFPPPATTGKP